jgi:hypothetical protein
VYTREGLGYWACLGYHKNYSRCLEPVTKSGPTVLAIAYLVRLVENIYIYIFHIYIYIYKSVLDLLDFQKHVLGYR